MALAGKGEVKCRQCQNEVARLWQHARIAAIGFPEGICTTCYVMEKESWGREPSVMDPPAAALNAGDLRDDEPVFIEKVKVPVSNVELVRPPATKTTVVLEPKENFVPKAKKTCRFCGAEKPKPGLCPECGKDGRTWSAKKADAVKLETLEVACPDCGMHIHPGGRCPAASSEAGRPIRRRRSGPRSGTRNNDMGDETKTAADETKDVPSGTPVTLKRRSAEERESFLAPVRQKWADELAVAEREVARCRQRLELFDEISAEIERNFPGE